MADQRALPGVLVESIKVEKPPFDEPGVVQEFVGRGATREFDAPKKADDLTPEAVEEALDSLERSIGPLRDSFKIRYNLIIRASPTPKPSRMGVTRDLQKRFVSTRARLFVRAKNPFEPDIIRVGEPSFDSKMSRDTKLNFYRVPAWVTK